MRCSCVRWGLSLPTDADAPFLEIPRDPEKEITFRAVSGRSEFRDSALRVTFWGCCWGWAVEVNHGKEARF